MNKISDILGLKPVPTELTINEALLDEQRIVDKLHVLKGYLTYLTGYHDMLQDGFSCLTIITCILFIWTVVLVV